MPKVIREQDPSWKSCVSRLKNLDAEGTQVHGLLIFLIFLSQRPKGTEALRNLCLRNIDSFLE